MHAIADLVGRGDRDVGEPGRGQAVAVLAKRERTGDAADVAAALGAVGGGEVVLGDDVADMPIRPPGVAPGTISANTAGLSVDRLITQLEITTSTDAVAAAGCPRCAPRRNSTLVAPASRRVRAGRGRASRRSCPARRPCRSGPTRRAESSTSMPPPEPRSSTVSPWRSSATADRVAAPEAGREGVRRQTVLLRRAVQPGAEAFPDLHVLHGSAFVDAAAARRRPVDDCGGSARRTAPAPRS